MRQVDVVDGLVEIGHLVGRRRMPAEDVAEEREDRRFVERREAAYPVAETAGDDGSVIGEPCSDVAIGPATAALQRQRQVPVVQADPRFDAGFEQPVDQPVVEGQPGLVERARALRQHARPGDRETIGADTDVAHQRDVLAPAMIVVAGDVAGVAVGDATRLMGKDIPDARSPTIFRDGAFDLVTRGGYAPHEVRRQAVIAGRLPDRLCRGERRHGDLHRIIWGPDDPDAAHCAR